MEGFSFNRKPNPVRKAQLTGDTPALQRMARAAAEARARHREAIRTEEEMLRIAQERDRLQGEHERVEQANEHIIPPTEYD
ncbi:MAG: hypothetical protein ACM3TU_01660 [Bacillota bacterium]